jgi:hypothetical protein
MTHFAPGNIAGIEFTEQDQARYRAEIAKNYDGPVTFAQDLEKF